MPDDENTVIHLEYPIDIDPQNANWLSEGRSPEEKAKIAADYAEAEARFQAKVEAIERGEIEGPS